MCALDAEFGSPEEDRPEFKHEPPPDVAEAIKRALAPSIPSVMDGGTRLAALKPVDAADGSYRLVTEKGSWFVRVSSRLRNPALELAITHHLDSRGVNVNPLLVAGIRLQWNGRALRVDVRPMIIGRHFNGSSADLERLASTVAACHRALRGWSGADTVRAAAYARNERLASIRHQIVTTLKNDALRELVHRESWTAEYASWANTHRDWLVAMTEHFDPHLDRWPGAQCLHGQIHRYNVLFRSDDGAAVLVDFEDSVHVFAPVDWDLAYLVQRFCLDDDPPLSVGRDRYSIIAKAYGISVRGLTEMMRQTAWLSVAAILGRHVSHDIVTPLAEYDKFVRLERQTRTYESVL